MKKLIEYEKVKRTIRRISHEIIERNADINNIILLGIKRKGFPLAKMISENILHIENIEIPAYELDVRAYRDDIDYSEKHLLNVDVNNKIIILVDDVLYTGRTVRSAMDAVIDLGRPSKIQLAVLIDRGHRELPIRADYVGKNIPTSSNEKIIVDIQQNPGIYIIEKE
jgi:pyrimidine operon attenuation protein/uracil phosphoribosyltransferase